MTPTSPRTVMITGASAGIGRAAARAFGHRGDRVALIARGETGFNAQQTGQPADADRSTNLWVPLDGAEGTDDGAPRRLRRPGRGPLTAAVAGRTHPPVGLGRRRGADPRGAATARHH